MTLFSSPGTSGEFLDDPTDKAATDLRRQALLDDPNSPLTPLLICRHGGTSSKIALAQPEAVVLDGYRIAIPQAAKNCPKHRPMTRARSGISDCMRAQECRLFWNFEQVEARGLVGSPMR
jgi:hypothetical protein